MIGSTPIGCDVLVVGAGIAGSMSAALLARLGLNVVLLHAPGKPRLRPELISPEAALHLQRLGFPTDRLGDIGVRCPGVVDRWRRQVPVYTNFELTRCAPAWAVERDLLDEALRSFAARLGARIVQTDGLVRLKDSPLESRLTLANARGEAVKALFLIDATGMTSSLMETSLRRRLKSDRLTAVTMTLDRCIEPADWMHLSSSSEGWWYALSTVDSASRAVFMTDGDLLPKNREHLGTHLRTQFEEAFPTQCSLRDVPARTSMRFAGASCRKCLWRGRWLPIGDAAFTLDPLAGNGIGRALQMAEDVARFDWRETLAGNLDAPCQAALANVETFNQLRSQLRAYYSGLHAASSHAVGCFWRRRQAAPLKAEPPLHL